MDLSHHERRLMKYGANHRGKLWTHGHTPREVVLKAIITALILGAFMLNEHAGIACAIAGNLVWLWADFD